MEKYYTTFDGEFEGRYREAGSEIRMTPAQAKYHLLAGTLSTKKPGAKKTQAAKLDQKAGGSKSEPEAATAGK